MSSPTKPYMPTMESHSTASSSRSNSTELPSGTWEHPYSTGQHPSTSDSSTSSTSSHRGSTASIDSQASGVVGHEVSPLDRDYPAPISEIDVAAALQRAPGRWSIKGQMNANEERARRRHVDLEAEKEARKVEMEEAKAKLLEFSKQMS